MPTSEEMEAVLERTFARLRGVETGLGQAGYCPSCERHCPEGPDPCLGLIPGVAHACCGHGNATKAYVVIGGPEGVDADCETFRRRYERCARLLPTREGGRNP